MADLTTEGTQSAGLGTRGARYTLLLVWALGIWSTLMQGALGQHLPQLFVAVALQFIAVFLLTIAGARKLPWPQGLMCAIAAIFAGLIVLFSAPMVEDFWLFNFATYLLALLTMRGNVWEGVVGGFSLIVAALVFGIALGTAFADIFAFLVLPAVAWVIGMTWRITLTIAIRLERVHLTEAELSGLAAEASEAAIAKDKAMIDEVHSEAGPALNSIRLCRPIGEAEALQFTVLAEGIRDRIRSPQLRHPLLDYTIRAARERGVRVQLLGTDSAGSELIGEPIARALAMTIAGLTQGSVTVRANPDGRKAAVSLLISGADTSRRVHFDHNGDVLE